MDDNPQQVTSNKKQGTSDKMQGGSSQQVAGQAQPQLVQMDQRNIPVVPIGNPPDAINTNRQLAQDQNQQQGQFQDQNVADQTMGQVLANPQSQTPQQLVSQPQPVGVGGDKEVEPIARPESVPLVELREHHEVEPEVEGWIEHLEQDGEIKIPDAIKDENGDVVMANADDVQVIEDKLVLPMTQSSVQQNSKGKISDSARWLAEWCLRLIKMLGGKVKYKEGEKN